MAHAWTLEFDELPVKLGGVQVGRFSGVAWFLGDRIEWLMVDAEVRNAACLELRPGLHDMGCAVLFRLLADAVLDRHEDEIAEECSPAAARERAADRVLGARHTV